MQTTADRLAALRAAMATEQLDALIIPRSDEYLGEYIPAHNERLLWATGFTGSAGAAIVLRDRAAMFVDGRYTVQVRQQVDAACYAYHDLVNEPQEEWLLEALPANARVGYDPRLHPASWTARLHRLLGAAGLVAVALERNLVDACWQDRPKALAKPALLLSEHYTGERSAAKRERLAARLRDGGLDAALIFAPDSVSWLLNIRGTDIPCLPIVQSFAVLHADATLQCFIAPERVPDGLQAHVGEGVILLPESAAREAFGALVKRRVLFDPDTASAWMQQALEAAGAELVRGADPVLLPKAGKNAVEIEGARAAHRRDAVAVIRFLHWLDEEVDAGRLHDEAVLAEQLGAYRDALPEYHGPSFDTISAAAVNAAMCHYNHRNSEAPAVLQPNSSYLVDSGGQYTDGTTDITRTIAIGHPAKEVRERFTLVLKGHIALATARFPRGTSGGHLDALARQFLWQAGLDYEHGTGHGVGAFLSVHEGPQRIARHGSDTPLIPGMILSNEPGYYEDGQYGIRCENLVVVRDDLDDSAMLGFEALTLVPFDNRMLDTALLTPAEIQWLNDYHARVRDEIGPLCDSPEQAWLSEATRPVAA